MAQFFGFGFKGADKFAANDNSLFFGIGYAFQVREEVCRSIGKPPSVVGLSWLLSNPAVTAPIIGPRSVAQLNDALAALTCRLHELTIKKLDEIFPGPGGEAPNAYAW